MSRTWFLHPNSRGYYSGPVGLVAQCCIGAICRRVLGSTDS